MARKAKRRAYAGSLGAQHLEAAAAQRRQRLKKLVVGGIVLLLVLGSGALVRWLQQRGVATQLESGGNSRYTRGSAGAAVIIKEFSDYT